MACIHGVGQHSLHPLSNPVKHKPFPLAVQIILLLRMLNGSYSFWEPGTVIHIQNCTKNVRQPWEPGRK